MSKVWERYKDQLDEWEHYLVQKYNIRHPVSDYEAYDFYPGHRWVYDKYRAYNLLNEGPRATVGYTSGDSIVKPRVNFFGLGKNATYQFAAGSIPPGYVSQPWAEGPHYSVDLQDGQVLHIYQGRKHRGRFVLWHRVEACPRVPDQLLRLSREIGRLNFEMIEDKVIEVHLRPSVQFYSEPDYSLVFWESEGTRPTKVPAWRPDTVHDALLTDEEDDRVLIVNGDDLRTAYEYGLLILGGAQ